jgi:hypothetical protein
MLTCDKCGARGFITVEGDEFHCCLCGFVWYPSRSAGPAGEETGSRCGRPGTGTRIPRQRRDTWPGAE